jgi:hypothetical protein
MILSIGISIENMFIRFRAKLRHYALIITKFDHTCMVYTARWNIVHCTCTLTTDVLTRAHFVLLLEFVLYILYTFYAPISVSLIDRSLLRLTNRTSSCYKLRIIDIVPFCTMVLYSFTIHTAIRDLDFHRFIVIYHLTIENSLIWQSIFITSIIRKFPPDIRFCITDGVDQHRLLFPTCFSNLIRPWNWKAGWK